MGKLPEKGREIVRSLTQHLSPRDWDLSERAMHALHNIASAPGAQHAFEVCMLPRCSRDSHPRTSEAECPLWKVCIDLQVNRSKRQVWVLACDCAPRGDLAWSRAFLIFPTKVMGHRKGRRGVRLFWDKKSLCTSTASRIDKWSSESMPEGCSDVAQGSDVDKRLAQLEGEAKGENADQSDSYLSDLQALSHSTRAKIQVGCSADS